MRFQTSLETEQGVGDHGSLRIRKMNLIAGSPVRDRIRTRGVTIRGGYERSVLHLLRAVTPVNSNGQPSPVFAQQSTRLVHFFGKNTAALRLRVQRRQRNCPIAESKLRHPM